MKKLLKQGVDTGSEVYYIQDLYFDCCYIKVMYMQLVAVKIGILNVLEFIISIFILFK